MGEQYLHQKCPFLKALSQEKREQFEIYFRTAPDWLIDSLVVEKIKKGTTFIRENNPADTIYFIVEGLDRSHRLSRAWSQLRFYAVPKNVCIWRNGIHHGPGCVQNITSNCDRQYCGEDFKSNVREVDVFRYKGFEIRKQVDRRISAGTGKK